MKTKLLKIVRKRYSITKYTKLNNPNFILFGHTVPVWYIEDKEHEYRSDVADSLEDAHDLLIKRIRRDYVAKMYRENRQISEKVWYKPKK